MSKHSFVMIAAPHARKLAEAKLEEIDQIRKADIHAYVQRRLEELNNSFWRKLFGMKPFTHEQVEEMERSLPDLWANTIWEIENWNYDHSQRLCERVLIAVEYGEPIQLSLEDAEYLGARR